MPYVKLTAAQHLARANLLIRKAMTEMDPHHRRIMRNLASSRICLAMRQVVEDTERAAPRGMMIDEPTLFASLETLEDHLAMPRGLPDHVELKREMIEATEHRIALKRRIGNCDCFPGPTLH